MEERKKARMNFHVQLRPGETAQSSPLPHSGPSSPAQLPAAASARLLPTHPPTLHYTPHPTTHPCSRAAGAAGLLPARRVHPAAGGGRGGLCGEDAGECGDPLCISWKSCWRCRRPAGRAATRCAGWLPLWAAVGAGRGCRWGLHVREWRPAPYRDGTVEGALHGITMGTVGGIAQQHLGTPPTHTHHTHAYLCACAHTPLSHPPSNPHPTPNTHPAISPPTTPTDPSTPSTHAVLCRALGCWATLTPSRAAPSAKWGCSRSVRGDGVGRVWVVGWVSGCVKYVECLGWVCEARGVSWVGGGGGGGTVSLTA